MSGPKSFEITKLTLREYRSIARCSVKLRSLNLLVGPNGSGKSNFVDSLRFVSQSLNESLDNALRERGGVAEVRRRSTGHPRHFGIGINFTCPDFSGEYKFQIGAAKGGDYRVTHEACRLTWHDGRPDAHFEVRGGELLDSSVDLNAKTVDDRLYLVAMSGLRDFRPVFDALTDINVYNVNPVTMREPQIPDPGDLLRRDGANIPSVLESMRRLTPDRKRIVEEFLQRIVPGIVSVDRTSIGAWESLAFRQQVAGAEAPWQFQPTSISDGTMRALGVLVALFASQGTPYISPVAIEEPEAALHPAAAGYLLDALLEASRQRQVIATTHSPELLDSPSLDPLSLISVRAEAGRTVIAPINEVGRATIREGLFTAGELLRVDQLEPEATPHVPRLF